MARFSLAVFAAALFVLLGAAHAGRVGSGESGPFSAVSGSYFGSFTRSLSGTRAPTNAPLSRVDKLLSGFPGHVRTPIDAGTSVMCVCSSERIEGGFKVEGALAFLHHDTVREQFALSGDLLCSPRALEGDAGAEPCEIAVAQRTPSLGQSNLTLTLDPGAITGVQKTSHVATFAVETDRGVSYDGHIGSKLHMLDALCDDVACRGSRTLRVVPPSGDGDETLQSRAVPEAPMVVIPDDDLIAPEGESKQAVTVPAPEPVPVEEYGTEETPSPPEKSARGEAIESPSVIAGGSGGGLSAGKDGAAPPNHIGQLRCGGVGGAPDCGNQGFCLGETEGKECFWDCEPGFCSCTAGACFDEEGRCSLSATYPEANNWQATCGTGGGGTAPIRGGLVIPQVRRKPFTPITAGHDGANPANHVGDLRCGGAKGTPDCGKDGFCVSEATGQSCWWDCDPGFCSCSSGSCFDSAGKCTVSATYPEESNWQATCGVGDNRPTEVPFAKPLAGFDGARPPNNVGQVRCGGTAGEPDCGKDGFCLSETTGERCYWDCEPGYCSCTSGSCFDAAGLCTMPATYPEANNWQATCDSFV